MGSREKDMIVGKKLKTLGERMHHVAAPVRSDADNAFLPVSSAPGKRREVESGGSCCSHSIGRGIRLLEYRPRQEEGSRFDWDGSCCSGSIGRGLRLLEYTRWQEAGSRVDSD